MKVGIDVTVLQGPHRMRGVGYTLINFINNISDEEKKRHEFVLFLHEEGKQDALDLLDLTGFNYNLRVFKPHQGGLSIKASLRQKIKNTLKLAPSSVRAPLRTLRDYYGIYRDYYIGDKRIDSLHEIDRFLQFDQSQFLPRSSKAKTALIGYDLIPYVMEPDYLWSYSTARSKGFKRRSALNFHAKRHQYKKRIQLNCKRADYVFTISEHTKRDFFKYLKTPLDKIHVAPLGVDSRMTKSQSKDIVFERFVDTSWGYLPKKTDLSHKKFLLFVGGADNRRKISELVATFNNLRAQGHDIYLVLAGDTMKGAFSIPNQELQDYFANTSYLDSVYFLGFVSDQQREWLYENALAFVYPSVYEGFGLPILEAMQYGTPVITYANSSIPEVAGDAALIAKDYETILTHTLALLEDPRLRSQCAKKGKQQAKKFSWEKTSQTILDSITNSDTQN